MDAAISSILTLSTVAALASCHQVCFIGSNFGPQSGIQPRWFLPYEDPCKCTAIRLGGTSIPASSIHQGAPYHLDELILSEDPCEIRAYFKCKAECLNPVPLGLEDGTIPDNSISASSTLHIVGYSYDPWYGRLNNDRRWAADIANGCWIEVDFGTRNVVTGVTTQGSPTTDSRVTSYTVRYQTESAPSSGYQYVTDCNGHVK